MSYDLIFENKDVKADIIAQTGLVRELQKQYFSMAKEEKSRYKSKETKEVLFESKKQEGILDEMLAAYVE